MSTEEDLRKQIEELRKQSQDKDRRIQEVEKLRQEEAQEAERRLQEAEKRRQEADRRAGESYEKYEVIYKDTFIEAAEYLKEPMEDYNHKHHVSKKLSYTNLHTNWRKPALVGKWDDFDLKKDSVLELVGNKPIKRREAVFYASEAGLDAEINVHAFVEPTIRHAAYILHETKVIPEMIRTGQPLRKATSGGICDVMLSFQGVDIIVVELKRPTVRFMKKKNDVDGQRPHAADIFNGNVYKGVFKNVINIVHQIFSYLVGKGVKFGIFCNYDHWVFVRRYHNEAKQEVLEMSRFYTRVEAKVALAYFITKCVQEGRDPMRLGTSNVVVQKLNNPAATVMMMKRLRARRMTRR